MAFVITRGELEYEAGLILTGAYKIFLATKGSLTLTSNLSAWEAAELAIANGYAAATGTLGAGVYNATTGRVEAPTVTGQFTASGAGFTFDAMVAKLASRTAPYAINLYDTPITLAAGQSRGFEITFGVRP